MDITTNCPLTHRVELKPFDALYNDRLNRHSRHPSLNMSVDKFYGLNNLHAFGNEPENGVPHKILSKVQVIIVFDIDIKLSASRVGVRGSCHSYCSSGIRQPVIGFIFDPFARVSIFQF